jgi:hypothetical protein
VTNDDGKDAGADIGKIVNLMNVDANRVRCTIQFISVSTYVIDFILVTITDRQPRRRALLHMYRSAACTLRMLVVLTWPVKLRWKL